MKILVVKDKRDYKRFKNFRKDLYKNDRFYCSTVEFNLDMLLFKQTYFAKSCTVKPIIVEDGNKIIAECLLIFNPKDDFVQVAFFESLENCYDAVKLIKGEAEAFAKQNCVKRVIVGLNGHLSYGVGLTDCISHPNTFDSTYSKPYYIDYFKDGIVHGQTAFYARVGDVKPNLKCLPQSIKIRPLNLNDFDKEMEIFADICNKTIGRTFLYSQVEKDHFKELLGAMRFFLKKENLLLAFDGNEVVGFIFWHPDYNQILKKGKQNSLLSIALRYIFYKKRINRIKLNAIGVVERYQGNLTMRLLKSASEYMNDDHIIETNFVWNNNKRSMLINRHLLKNIERTFKVVEYRYD